MLLPCVPLKPSLTSPEKWGMINNDIAYLSGLLRGPFLRVRPIPVLRGLGALLSREKEGRERFHVGF